MAIATLATAKAAHRGAPAANADLTALKIRQQAAWSSGNYAVVGTTLQIVGEQLCETLDLRAGAKVLDVAAGNGMVSLAAARRWCEVTSTDYVPALLEQGRARAAAEGQSIEFIEADAEHLPFEDQSFDTVLSTFGVMFTPNQERAASELLRVCKPKGQIGLANWTPEGFIGQVFKTLGKYLPPPASAKSPALWGTRARLTEMFGPAAFSLARAFSQCVRDLLRPDPQSFRRSRSATADRTEKRLARPHRAHEPGERRHHDRAERIPRSRDHQAINHRRRRSLEICC